MIKRELAVFFSAIMFYTRIPCPKGLDYNDHSFQKATRYLPVIGLLVGSLAGFTFWASNFVVPLPIGILIAMLTSIWVTGAFHEDGLADVCDGMGGGWTKDQILSIMKDSRIGVYGVLGLLFSLSIKFSLLIYMNPATIPLALITGHIISRLMAATMIFAQPYVQPPDTSKVKPVALNLAKGDFILAWSFGIIAVLLINKFWYISLVVPGLITTWILGSYFKKRIGGYTGDCLGATQQINELIIYLIILLAPWKFI